MVPILDIGGDRFVVINSEEIQARKTDLGPVPPDDLEFTDMPDDAQDNTSLAPDLNWKGILESKYRKVLLQQNACVIKNTLVKLRLPKPTWTHQHRLPLWQPVPVPQSGQVRQQIPGNRFHVPLLARGLPDR